MSGRNSQVSRLYTLIALLESSRLGMTVKQILEALDDSGHTVTWRTVYRDLAALRKAGIPLLKLSNTDESDPSTMWKVETSKQSKTIAATPRELLALYFSHSIFADERNPFSADLDTLVGKFTARMGASHLKHLAELRKSAFVRSSLESGPEVDPEILDTLQSACAEGHWMSGDYTPAGKTLSARRLAPQFLLFTKEGLYLVAIDEKGVSKTYSAARFSRVEMLDEVFEGQRLTPETYMGSTMGLIAGSGPIERIELQFRYPYAQYIRERKWHPSQKLTDVGEECRITLDVCVTSDLVRWVLQFGSGVEVLGPAAFRDRIVSELERSLGRYSPKSAKKAA